ncbi:hypothetical protein [Helicobacter sp.]|uniref:hypothetical protein n=1 Tax=Helicobacter sp. TaxID=218 RepID=UPI00375294F2|nr:hypothetical protein [Helicobacter sp.]
MAWVCYCCLVIQQAINETLSFFGKTLFKWFGYISASYMLPLAGVFLCVFVGWILPKSQVYAMREGYLRTIAFEIWKIHCASRNFSCYDTISHKGYVTTADRSTLRILESAM